jgi:hypothetical protein
MPKKQDIIDNVEQYSASELVDYIKSGVVTFDELCNETDGYFSANARKEVQRLLAGSEENDWHNTLLANSEDSLLDFLRKYPDSCHADEARQSIIKIQKQQERSVQDSLWESVNKEDISSLRQFVSDNPNDEHCIEARKLINAMQEE